MSESIGLTLTTWQRQLTRVGHLLWGHKKVLIVFAAFPYGDVVFGGYKTKSNMITSFGKKKKESSLISFAVRVFGQV